MASKISNLSSAPAPVGAGHRADKARDAVSGGAAAAAGSGDVQITRSASLLASLERQLHGMPALDERRVAQYRTAIENGSYTVQPRHVAEQLMQIEHSLAQISGG